MTFEIIFEFRIELNKNYVYKYPTTINNTPMEVEIINLSDDGSNNGDQPRTSENINILGKLLTLSGLLIIHG